MIHLDFAILFIYLCTEISFVTYKITGITNQKKL